MPSTYAANGTEPTWSFGDKLRKARRVVNMSTREFAQAVGVTHSAYAQYESDRSLPRDIVGLAKRVETLTGVSALWLLDLTDRPVGERLSPQLAMAS